MAKASYTKGSTSKTPQAKQQHGKAPAGSVGAAKSLELAVRAISGNMSSPFYALADIGENNHKLPLDPVALHQVVRGVTGTIRRAFLEGIEALPAKAKAHLSAAVRALDSLDLFMLMCDEHAMDTDIEKSAGYRRMVGEVIVAFTGRAGREWERALAVLGAKDRGIGFLRGDYLSDGMQETTREEATLLVYFSGTNEEGRVQVTEFARVARDRHGLQQ